MSTTSPFATSPSATSPSRGSRRRLLPTTGAVVLVGALLLAACSGPGGTEPASAAGAVPVLGADDTAELLAGTGDVVVIDVRTPAEYDAGHVAGALLADVQHPGFDAQIDSLDRTLTYVLYCRSGNRSAVAAERMRAAGFTTLYDAGAFTDLALAGVPTA